MWRVELLKTLEVGVTYDENQRLMSCRIPNLRMNFPILFKVHDETNSLH
jgi:hypothetical protein